MEYMVSEYSRHGTEGPINWYRNFAANQDYVKASLTKKINTPALFINTTLDMVNDFGNNNAEHLTNFVEKKVVGGHWAHYAQPKEVNKHIGEWLKENFPIGN
ncbi:hypothetical protein DSO57_1037914 [Entomophthora muscae]|uniref:Uncharacterized protein n=1 Tax=Entomophthora muscae TaxID=34485 RepID=A0ACC2T9V1_9FUNG|nr:hypothetical protein DSO57_1037914 [Entomophthora muscae]